MKKESLDGYIGSTYGRLTVTGWERKPSGPYLLCNCRCGKDKLIFLQSLKRGITQSCGCLHAETTARINRKHGEFDGYAKAKPEYRSWTSMIQRCCDPAYAKFPDYGGRGITVCIEWRVSYKAFLCSVGRKPSAIHTLNRINNDGNYEPGNVEWATPTTQARNRRSTRHVTYGEETKSLAEWCELLKLPYKQTSKRLSVGWSIEKSFTQPYRVLGAGKKAKHVEITREGRG